MLARKIKSMKAGDSFKVGESYQRLAASQVGKTLFDAGAIPFRIVTRVNQDQSYSIVAVEE